MESNFHRRNQSRSRSHSPNYDVDQDGEFPSKSTHLFSGNQDPSYKFNQAFPEHTNSLFSEASLSTQNPIFIPHIPTTRCKFCQEQIPEDIIIEHQNVCDVKDAFCQACGEKVPLDMFDYHLESCQPMPISHMTNMKIHDEESPYVAQNFTDEFENPENDEWEEEQNHHYEDHHHHYNLPLIHHDQQNENQDDDSDNEDLTHTIPVIQSQNPLQILNQMTHLFSQLHANIQQQHQNAEDDDDDWEDEMDETDVQNYLASHDPSNLTYEQLMVLDEGIVKKGLSETDIEKFPLEMYLKDCDGEHSCSICLTEYESGEVMRKLTCSHKFHKDCVDTWLQSNITCPICKKYFR